MTDQFPGATGGPADAAPGAGMPGGGWLPADAGAGDAGAGGGWLPADAAPADAAPADAARPADAAPADSAPADAAPADRGALDSTEVALYAAEAKAAEYLADLQRLQAEYTNYRRRVERDRTVARDLAVAQVVEALIPALDDIDLARQHGELDGGPFAAIAEKLEATLARFGWERYGVVGEGFDPTFHEALMHGHSTEVIESTVTQVLQPGHRVGDRILRAARVAVTDPE